MRTKSILFNVALWRFEVSYMYTSVHDNKKKVIYRRDSAVLEVGGAVSPEVTVDGRLYGLIAHGLGSQFVYAHFEELIVRLDVGFGAELGEFFFRHPASRGRYGGVEGGGGKSQPSTTFGPITSFLTT